MNIFQAIRGGKSMFQVKKTYDEGKAVGIIMVMAAVAVVLEKQGYPTEEIKATLEAVKAEMSKQAQK